MSLVEVMGILSLIFWSLILVVTIKYVTLIMRADNRGEGGILALMALAQRASAGSRVRSALGIHWDNWRMPFFGDGLITPAISVLSAVEGLEVSEPGLKQYVLPISVTVIVALFALQRRGTGSVGRIFGPVMTVWFLLLGLLGLVEVVQQPSVLLAVSPSYAAEDCHRRRGVAFLVLGRSCRGGQGRGALYVHGPLDPRR